MIANNTYTLLDEKNGELAFKLYTFESLHQFDHIQRLPYYSIIWIQSGKGKALIDTEVYNYEANTLFACSPFQPFMFAPQMESKGVVLHFHPNFFCIHKHHSEIACDGILFNNVYEHPFVEITTEDVQQLSWLIEGMKNNVCADKLATQDAILSYLKLILIQCSRIKQETQEPQSDPASIVEENELLHRFKGAIEQHYKNLHAPKDYAELLHISPNALSKFVKANYGKTPSQLIAERIIIETKRELYLTNKTVEEIAYELGYEDPFYFSRFFKKHVQVSPSAYRLRMGSNKAAAL
ncbi:AraC-type DNA-binding protein [Lishizhenia tianjinensis]|uniref:AraC-type DNA-binding protein n=1 Tax=Lishizhenia tianjinensis TaxID=477690 RepID=A0A1I6XVN2_9FLAO|nr:helix-turn-helix domain-containing protein [Lishizhenia tianjinensis]SFT41961.1 AraC-type DNA-binding protein [Lishizhenia tianjinensis]